MQSERRREASDVIEDERMKMLNKRNCEETVKEWLGLSDTRIKKKSKKYM